MAAPVRLQRYLASGGVAARRKAEEMITAGRVMVNGAVVRVLGTKIDPDNDSVTVDGEAVVAHDFFYVLFNKPKACITAVTDDRGRPTVMDYLPNLPVPVKPVGRLDFYSEGVLLLTNDGELASRLLAPASHVAKTYHVKVHGQVTKEDLATLRGGVMLDDGSTTLPADVTILPGESKYTWLGITIHEGKHRQIHRMLEARGYRVDKLQRVAFANLTFHNLRIGDARELTQLELNELRSLVGLDHSTIARGAWRVDREKTDVPRRAKTKARLEAEDAANAPPPDADGEGGAEFAAEVDDAGAEDGDDRDDLAAYEDSRGPGPAARPRSAALAPPSAAREPRGSGGRDSRGPGARDSRSAGARDSRGPGARDSRSAGARDSRGGGAGTRDARGGGFGARDARGGGFGARDARGPSRDPRGDRGPRGGAAGRDDRSGARPPTRTYGAPRTTRDVAGDRAPRGARPDHPRGGRGGRDDARAAFRGGRNDTRADGPRTNGPRGSDARSTAPRSTAPRGTAPRTNGPRTNEPRGKDTRAPGGPRGTSYGTTRPSRPRREEPDATERPRTPRPTHKRTR